MNPDRDVQRLTRAKWVGVLLPIALIWGFELVRWRVIDPAVPPDSAHLFAALVMSGGAVLFALGIFAVLDRAQRRLVETNVDLAATHAVSSALEAGGDLAPTLATTLQLVLDHTGALVGQIRLAGPAGTILRVERPTDLEGGLRWLRSILDEDPPAAGSTREAEVSERSGVDATVVDVLLTSGSARVGSLRLVLHPSARPRISLAALGDLGVTIGTAAGLATSLADLRREEHERAALYGVALQLTGRAELRDLLDLITKHARELLGADRAVACLADPRLDGRTYEWTSRLAVADDGSTCLMAHPTGGGDEGRGTAGQPAVHHNPACPVGRNAERAVVLARPLRGADGFLGELCVVRAGVRPFTDRERELLGALADLAAVAVGTARLREKEEQFAIVAERDRIARELHDSIAQVLGVIHLRLRSIQPEVVDVPGNGVATELADLADLADEAYKDVREAILGLRETVGAAEGLEGALREHLRKYSRQTGIKTSLDCDGEARRAISPRSEVQLLRVVQEALTNVRKHAGARHVAVTLHVDGGLVRLAIMDDGRGFDPGSLEESLDHGFGLASMRERAEQIGGELAVHTAPGMGTRIEVRLRQEESRAAHAPDAARAAGR